MIRLGAKMVVPNLVPAKHLWTINKYGAEPGQVRKPLDVCFMQDGTIAFSDVYNYRVQLVDLEGNPVKEFTDSNFEPRNVTCTKFSEIAVADVQEKCVRLFDPRSGTVRQFGNEHLQRPFGIATENSGRIYVTDACAQSILIFTSDGILIETIKPGNLENPLGITVDKNNKILVCDADACCVKVYTVEGKYKGGIVSRDLDFPTGITVDSDSNLIVANSGQHKVSLYSNQGQHMSNLVTSSEHFLRDPRGVAINDSGQLAVISWEESKCMLYQVYNV